MKDHIKAFLFTLIIALLVIIPFMVFGQTPSPTPLVAPETLEGATELLPVLIEALMKSQWAIVGAITTMLLTLVVKLYALPKWNLSTKLLPWVALVLAFLNGVASHVFLGLGVKESASIILLSGGLASQFWSLGGKTLIDLLTKSLDAKEK